MNDWRTFLTEQGATWQGDRLVDFSEQNASSSDRQLAPMLDHALLLVEGPDAQSFLQGQTTCDFRLLTSNTLIRGAHCTPKGRMLFSFWAFALAADQLALRIPTAMLELTKKALQKYIVFSKADLRISDWVGVLVHDGSSPTNKTRQFEYQDNAIELTHEDGTLEAWGDPLTMSQRWHTYSQPSSTLLRPPSYVQLWHIRQGLADVQPETSDQFLPQQFNFHLTQGIDFKKGCYTGQEIVARLHYKGQVKKLLVRGVVSPTPHPITPGTPLTQENSNKEIGVVIEAAQDHAGNEILVCGNPELLTAQNCLYNKNSPVKISWDDLPYAIPKE